MTSLVPGTIFLSSGFNRKSTPTPRNITPDQLEKKYKREPYNGHDWPADSPVSRSYDVANTSTKLIILNNKYGQNSTRLRGYYTGPKKPDRSVNPDRHRVKSPRDPRYHEMCLDSSSPKFEPSIKTDLDWLSSSQRPPNALIVRSSVNPRRHDSCRTSPEMMHLPHGRPHSRLSLPAKYLYNSEYADMSIGERIYLWSIEKIYNVEKMKKLKQEQYQKLLDGEAKKGNHSAGEYVKYRRYISSATDRSYGTGSPAGGSKRSKSAYSQRSRSSQGKPSPAKSDKKSEEKETEPTERPKTSMGQTRKESRERSKSPERGSKSPERGSKSPERGSKSPERVSKSPERGSKSPERATIQRSASAGSEDRKPHGSQTSLKKSPASSRMSSARSQRTATTRSRSSSRVSSKASLRSTEHTNYSTKGDNSDTKTKQHKEGKDRPKSRLGHPGGTDDRDKDDSLHSSNVSIKSDYGTSSESGQEKPDKNLTKPLNSSSGNSIDNGTKQKSESEYNQKKVKGNTTRPNKTMGSRVSVGSKASKTSDNNEQNKANIHGNTVDSKDNANEKVHRIPSASYIEDEANDAKVKDDMKDDNNGTQIESKDNKDNSKSSVKLEEKVDSDKDNGEMKQETDTENTKSEQENRDDVKDTEKESDNQRKTDSDTSDDFYDNKVNKKGEKEGSDKNEDSDTSKDSSDDNRKKSESEDETKVEDNNEDDSKVKNKLSRQDSFDDEDDDRKVNKDLDKIEY